jgi:5'-3' exonuclease
MIVHLVDGTYELFRHFYGLRRFTHVKGSASRRVDRPYGAIVGVLQSVLQIIDSVKGSAPRSLIPGEGSTSSCHSDDALASAAHLASKDKKVEKVAIWTPDKDLAQCVQGTRVVQIDGRRNIIRDAAGVRDKFGVDPLLIPDLLALVGDAADGYPGIAGIGARTAAQLLNCYGRIEKFPSNVLGEQRKLALLFKKLATLRTDAPLFKKVETLRWRGPKPAFAKWAKRMKAPRLLERCEKARRRFETARPCF